MYSKTDITVTAFIAFYYLPYIVVIAVCRSFIKDDDDDGLVRAQKVG